MDRMLFIVKKVAVRTTDTMAAVILAIVLNDVCNDVEVVPSQQTLQDETFANRSTGTDGDARLDIKAINFFHSRSRKMRKCLICVLRFGQEGKISRVHQEVEISSNYKWLHGSAFGSKQ